MKTIKFLSMILTFLALFASSGFTEETGRALSGPMNPLTEGDPSFVRQYLLEVSGTIHKEVFSGANVLLQITDAGDLDPNPYLLLVQGYPYRNSRNIFFWNSDDKHMEAVANQITCEIKRSLAEYSPMHFYYLSPSLLRTPGTAVEAEQRRREEASIPATKIEARAGQLKIKIHSDTVTGTVWMKGYDPVEKAYVLYTARIFGRRASRLKEPRGEKPR